MNAVRIGRHLVIELAWLVGALALALVITWGAAWSYPLGAHAIWTIGLIVMAVVVVINLRALGDARAKDRNTHA